MGSRIVKCIDPLADFRSLTKGKEYLVITVSIVFGKVYYQITDDGQKLRWVKADLFKTILDGED